MFKYIRLVMVFCFVLSSHKPVFGETGEVIDMGSSLDNLIFMEIFTITSASKYQQDVGMSPVAISVLTSEDIERSGAKNMADLLKRLPGVWSWVRGRSDLDVGTNGVCEDDNPRLKYLLNGQPVSTPMFDGMQWPQLPVTFEEIDRIEITRSGGSALYGANAYTGVMNIITKSSENRKSVLKTYVGDGGIQLYSLTGAHSFGKKLSVAVTGGWRQEGVKKSWHKSTNEEEADAYATPIVNVRVDYKGAQEEKLSLFGGYSNGEGGYGATPGDPAIDHVHHWENRLLQARYVNSSVLDMTQIQVNAEVFTVHQHNYKPYADNVEKYNVSAFRHHVEANLTTKVFPRQTWLVGGVYQYNFIYSKGGVNNLKLGREHSSTLIGSFVQNEYNIWDPLTLIGSVRYDAFNDVSDELSGRGTALYQVNKNNIVRASVGRSYRKPHLYNQYYIVTFPGGIYQGDPALRSQHAIHYEAEYRTRSIPRHNFKLSYTRSIFEQVYFNHYTVTGGFMSIRKSSTDHVYLIHTYIAEIDGMPVRDVLKWYANVSFYYAKDDTISRKMADVPEYMCNAGFQYFILKDLYLSMDYHYQDDVYPVEAGTDGVNGIPAAIESFHVVDAKIGFSPRKGLDLGLSVENLFNEKHREFPVVPERTRTLYAEARWSFGGSQ